ncbi:glycosyltransferase [Microbulbifer sp. YPW16]|uniref:glycosyltransferase n=1 Tax=Microbulbifer sp. YPW16 TaxID=2904242 RepID=UPI001E2E0EB9|nr:glycosyltransferase [Microbulbifer sp. YPW16]UHQ55873.1 glycosyltransferase [Microbulbifer sp. YPW16]
MAKSLVFTVATDGYDQAFARNITSHRRYAKKYGHDYQLVSGPGSDVLNREVAWLKIPLLIGAIDAGYESIMFVDGDAAIQKKCPNFEALFEDGYDAYLANGHSGRPNSGVIIIKSTTEVKAMLERVLQGYGKPLASIDSVGWGENGYVIHELRKYERFKNVSLKWNNTWDIKLKDYIRHYTGPMRKLYEFSVSERQAWDEICSRPKIKGEGFLTNGRDFFEALSTLYSRVTNDTPCFSAFDFSWCGFPKSRRSDLSVGKLTVHSCVNIDEMDPDNPYSMELAKGLRLSGANVITGADGFWDLDYSKIDVLHIQWMEVLCGWKAPTEEMVEKIEHRIQEIAETTKIVFTFHNLLPKKDFGRLGFKLLDIVAMYASAFIHLSNESIAKIKEQYKGCEWVEKDNHYVCRHGDFDYYRMVEEDWPELTQLDGSGSTVLVFGGIRNKDELDFSLNVGDKLAQQGHNLILAGPVSDEAMHWKERKGIQNPERSKILRLHQRVQNEHVKALLKKADVVLIPRAERLNSGVVFLAHSFGVPVVCSDEVTLSESLNVTRGVVYRKNNVDDAVNAILSVFKREQLEKIENEAACFLFKKKCMSWISIADQHLKIYQSV